MTNPADLYDRTGDALGQLRDLRRKVVELSREYALLDPTSLTVDELGEPLATGEALAGAREGLAAVDHAIGAVDDAFDRALRYGSRLGRPPMQTDNA